MAKVRYRGAQVRISAGVSVQREVRGYGYGQVMVRYCGSQVR